MGLILAVSISGMWLLKKGTPYGLGLNTDSVYYVNGARNILEGNGFYRNSGEDVLKPITHFPPFFAYILSAVGLTGLDPLRGGRLVIILLYGGNPILFAWLVWRLTRSSWLAFLGAGLMAFSTVNLAEYSWLMSEPLYLCLMLISVMIAFQYYAPGENAYVILLGVLSGLMYATRYVGLSMLVTWLIGICLFIPGWRKKMKQAGLFLVDQPAFPDCRDGTQLSLDRLDRQPQFHPALGSIHKSGDRHPEFLVLVPATRLYRSFIQRWNGLLLPCSSFCYFVP